MPRWVKDVWAYVWWLWQVVLFFVPHFKTEKVVVQRRLDGDYDMLFPVSQALPGERFDGFLVVTSLVWLFWCFPVTADDDIKPWSRLYEDVPRG